ncbi:MAG: hypothetical protein WC713_00905 [Candidatus Methylomirabilota bacterium]|jgi:hypothetical protein
MTPAGFDLPIRVLYGGKGYEVLATMRYWSPRYKKWITAPWKMIYDGSTGVPDLLTAGPVYHDVVCHWKSFDDGTPCSNLQASFIIHDVMKDEGRWGRCKGYFVGTLIGRPISNFFGSLAFWSKKKSGVTWPKTPEGDALIASRKCYGL